MSHITLSMAHLKCIYKDYWKDTLSLIKMSYHCSEICLCTSCPETHLFLLNAESSPEGPLVRCFITLCRFYTSCTNKHSLTAFRLNGWPALTFCFDLYVKIEGTFKHLERCLFAVLLRLLRRSVPLLMWSVWSQHQGMVSLVQYKGCKQRNSMT